MNGDRRMIPGGGPVEEIPLELRSLDQWVGWRLVDRDGKATKIPVNAATNTLASSTDSKTWSTFDAALAGASGGRWDGVGFVFAETDPFCGIDLDEAIDAETGEIDADAAATVDRFATYAELSPSRTGLHLILRGLPLGGAGRKRADRECYFHSRFFTFTGLRASPHGVEDRQDVLSAWHAETFPLPHERKPLSKGERATLDLGDEELVQKILESKQGAKFGRLWSGDTDGYASGSEADMALCSILAGWCQRDAVRVDRIYRSSDLYRPKWDAKRGDGTYGSRTVAKAVASVNWEYDPGYRGKGSAYVRTEPNVEPGDDKLVAGIDDLKRAGAEIQWVWPGWIQRRVVTAVAAQGGTGKTRLMADLVRRVRHRLSWPDGTTIDCPVGDIVALWVVSDNHHDEMVTLCDAFGISDCVKLNAWAVDPYGGVTLDEKKDMDLLEKRVKATNPLFVVVDTVGNATDRNLSRQEDAKAFYQPLQLLARAQGVAVMALTHLNAGGKVLGRRALEKVRVCFRMSAPDNDHSQKRRLEVIKSNSKKPERHPLGVKMGSTGNEYDDDPPPPPEDEGSPKVVFGKGTPTNGSSHSGASHSAPEPLVRTADDYLIEVLRKGPDTGMTSDEIETAMRSAKWSGRSSIVSAALSRLSEDGLLQTTGVRRSKKEPQRYLIPRFRTSEKPTVAPGTTSGNEMSDILFPASHSRDNLSGENAGNEMLPSWVEIHRIVELNGPLTPQRIHELSGYSPDDITSALAHFKTLGAVSESGGSYRASQHQEGNHDGG